MGMKYTKLPPRMKIMLDDGAYMPTRAHENDAGLDLYAMATRNIQPHSWDTIDTGVHVEIPSGYVSLLTSKSGLMRHKGLTTRGTIDSGYTGSIQAIVFNHGYDAVRGERGQKITQLVIMPCVTPDLDVVDSLEETDRGDRGFGSSGR